MEKEKKQKSKQEEKDCLKEKKEQNNSEIKELQNKLAEEQARCMRIQADMINYKKRKEEELSAIYKYSNIEMAKSILPTIDNFERALKTEVSEEASDEVKKFLEGFNMIYTNLVRILNDLGVNEIDANGVEFNPNYHQAVLTEKDENKPSNVVLEVLQKGYMYKDKVIRPAMVKVNE